MTLCSLAQSPLLSHYFLLDSVGLASLLDCLQKESIGLGSDNLAETDSHGTVVPHALLFGHFGTLGVFPILLGFSHRPGLGEGLQSVQ